MPLRSVDCFPVRKAMRATLLSSHGQFDSHCVTTGYSTSWSRSWKVCGMLFQNVKPGLTDGSVQALDETLLNFAFRLCSGLTGLRAG